MADTPTWTISLDAKESTMIVRALEQCLAGRESGPLVEFELCVLTAVRNGAKSITGDRQELRDLADAIDVAYAVKSVGGGPVAVANSDFANRWACGVYDRLNAKPDGVRKVAGKPVAKSLFGDE